MKRVKKRDSPTIFEEWKAKKTENWEPSYRNLRKPEKVVLHEALLSEQGWVCCYCGRSVTRSESHIEHFRPQTGCWEGLALDYANLHASCNPEHEPRIPLHCGHAKGNRFEEGRCISPLLDSCEERFTYTSYGDIAQADLCDEPAGYMLELLNLDVPFLRNQRKKILQFVFDPEFLASMTALELSTLRDAFRSPDGEGRLPDFGHVLARYAEQRLADPSDV